MRRSITYVKSCRQDIEKEERTMRKGRQCAPGKQILYGRQLQHFAKWAYLHSGKSEFKSRIKGNVIDRSATGSTVFIEPTAAARHYDALQLLYIEEENEVRRILYALTDMLYQQKEVIEQDLCMIEKWILFFQSKAQSGV